MIFVAWLTWQPYSQRHTRDGDGQTAYDGITRPNAKLLHNAGTKNSLFLFIAVDSKSSCHSAIGLC